MANTPISYDEIRFDVREPEITHVYVYVRDMDGSFPIVRGWHHKAFPSSMSALDIMKAWADGKEDPIMWPLNAPPAAPADFRDPEAATDTQDAS